MAESVERRYENIWQIFLLCTVFAGGSWRTWRSTASSRTLLLSLFQKIICIISVTMLFFFFCLLHHCRYKLINPEQEDAITSCCQFRSKIKGHFLVERSIDWTMKPKSGVQYSTVSGLWRKADPRIASYYITAKISFKGWKKKQQSVFQAVRCCCSQSLISLFFFFSWAHVSAFRASITLKVKQQ